MKTFSATAFFCLVGTAAALAQTAPQVRSVASFHAVEVSNGIELRLAPGTTSSSATTAT